MVAFFANFDHTGPLKNHTGCTFNRKTVSNICKALPDLVLEFCRLAPVCRCLPFCSSVVAEDVVYVCLPGAGEDNTLVMHLALCYVNSVIPGLKQSKNK